MRPTRSLGTLCVALGGCTSTTDEASVDCIDTAPSPGTVIAKPLSCEGEIADGGEARGADFVLANAWLRVVIRHPQSALTVFGIGGGTAVDVTPWGETDRVHEIIPVVGGGWLDVEEVEVLEDGIRVAGVVASLPDRPAGSAGEWREITWTLAPDGPWLVANGARGWFVHSAGKFELLNGQLWHADMLIGHDGDIEEDLGGVVRIANTDRLLVSSTRDAIQWLAEAGGLTQRMSGQASGATRLVLWSGSERRGIVALDGGDFDVTVPSDIDGVQAEADGRGPSPRVAPAEGLTLELGGTGTIHVSFGVMRPVVVTWADGAGRHGLATVPPEGADLALGSGHFSLDFSAGPSVEIASTTVDVPVDNIVSLELTPTSVFDPGPRVLIATPWYGDRSKDWRGTDARALREAIAAGASYAVVAPDNDVASAEPSDDDATFITWRNGTRLSTGEFSIVAWPLAASTRYPGHGAVDPASLSAEDALALLTGTGTGVFTAVDLPWLAAAGWPLAVSPRPDFVLLDSPGADPQTAWAEWFGWLDHDVPLVPLGPFTWVDLADSEYSSTVDIEAWLIRGHAAATTGPLLTLTLDGHGPGEVVPVPEDGQMLAAITASGAGLETVVLLGTGGKQLGQWDLAGLPFAAQAAVTTHERWVIAAAWGSAGEWAVTGPIWVGRGFAL